MMNEEKFLTSMLHTVQMGQTGIRSVMKNAVGAQLKTELKAQLKEYDAIETEAHNIAKQRGWKLSELNPAVRSMADSMTKMKLTFGCNDSKIAAMMVQGNTRGVIKGLKNSHRYAHDDQQVSELSRKLLDCENSNILQMEGYL